MIEQTPIQDGEAREADLCIVGCGAAGLALASRFIKSGRSVIMIESGGATPVPASDARYAFISERQEVALHSRMHGFGGTTARWAGRWQWLDPIDFEQRAWVPNSGWPITRDELIPYYEQADAFVGLSSVSTLPVSTLFPHDKALEAAGMRFEHETRTHWGKRLRTQFDASTDIAIHLGAHAARLEAQSGRIVALHAYQGDAAFEVRAKTFVVAAGGIENARLLLLSGLGGDAAGRYYMDHPKAPAGVIEAFSNVPLGDSAFFHRRSGPRTVYRIAETIQRGESLLNSHLVLEPLTPTGRLARLYNRIVPPEDSPVIAVRNYLEQPPIPGNRVRLSEELDPFGLPRASVSWDIDDMTRETANALHRHLRSAVESTGIGMLESPLLDGTPIAWGDASHHLGTTRMGTHEETSVVDKNCRVHTVDNLYVAGSSVFPTGGSAPPTATAVALAFRLAEHIRSTL